MRTLILAVLCLTGALIANFMLTDESIAKDSADGKVLRHIVMYKFKPDATKEQVQEVVDTFAALPKKIDLIKSLEYGTNVSKEGKSEGFTHVFVVSFASEKDCEAYINHPAHQNYVNVVKDRREKVVVFDFWTSGK